MHFKGMAEEEENCLTGLALLQLCPVEIVGGNQN